MVPVSELLADLHQRKIGQLSHQIHGNLPSFRLQSGAVLPADLIFSDGVVAGRFPDDLLRLRDIISDAFDVCDRALDRICCDNFVENILICC